MAEVRRFGADDHTTQDSAYGSTVSATAPLNGGSAPRATDLGSSTGRERTNPALQFNRKAKAVTSAPKCYAYLHNTSLALRRQNVRERSTNTDETKGQGRDEPTRLRHPARLLQTPRAHHERAHQFPDQARAESAVKAAASMRVLRRSAEAPASEARDGVAGTRDSSSHDPKDVGRHAGSAGVAADRGHGRVLAVLRSGLNHAARPNLLHASIVVTVGSTRTIRARKRWASAPLLGCGFRLARDWRAPAWLRGKAGVDKSWRLRLDAVLATPNPTSQLRRWQRLPGVNVCA